MNSQLSFSKICFFNRYFLTKDDENVMLIDTRYINVKQPFWKSGNLGGGIWRMKWHPYTSNRMLVGAMHGGCCVLNFHGTSLDGGRSNDAPVDDGIDIYNEHWTMKCTKYFQEHESMVYGADWLVCPHPTQNGYFEAAARYVYCLCSLFLYLHYSIYLQNLKEIADTHSTSLFNTKVARFTIERCIFGIPFFRLNIFWRIVLSASQT